MDDNQNQGGLGGGMPPTGDQPMTPPAAPTDQPSAPVVDQPTPAPTMPEPQPEQPAVEQPGMGSDTGTGPGDTSGGENPTGGATAM